MQLHDKRVVLTGASSGIGKELASELAQRGAKLLLVGRRQTELKNISQQINDVGGVSQLVAADITTSGGRTLIVNEARRSLGGVDILINNAGISDFNSFTQADPALIELIYKTNVVAPVLLAQAVVPVATLFRQEVPAGLGASLDEDVRRDVRHREAAVASNVAGLIRIRPTASDILLEVD